MMYEDIECPMCGNVTTAKSIDGPQKCMWCRRLFKVRVTRRGGKKFYWEVEAVDFPPRDVSGYTNRLGK